MKPPDFNDVRDARARIAGRIRQTPTLRSPMLDRQSGATVLVKAEPLQMTGSFKLRGATNAVLQIPPSARPAGVVTHSSGNHAQAVAAAAAAAGLQATVFMPADAPIIKRERTAAWGATIHDYDRRRDDREALARNFAAATGATLVPPFDHPHVIAGQGTLGLELAEAAAAQQLALDLLLAPAGGGGLIAGCALAFAALSPGTRIYAVEPEGWEDTGRSLRSGQRETAAGDGSLLCDALLSLRPGAITFPINQRLLAGGLTVTDTEVLAAMDFAFRELKLVVEPGGAVALAALLAGRLPVAGRAVGIVLSGGNVDPETYRRAILP